MAQHQEQFGFGIFPITPTCGLEEPGTEPPPLIFLLVDDLLHLQSQSRPRDKNTLSDTETGRSTASNISIVAKSCVKQREHTAQ